ncbi:MAG TPA: DUF2750 domain-containing protein [Armatimonadota bacterium]|nr:DUF2750 domain-containing protein [Armatimonadota bacterium]
MTWEMHPKEFASVVALPGPERYEYFIKRVADWESIWGLYQDGWFLMGDAEGRAVFPVWPHPRFAEAIATGDWDGAVAREISLDDFREKWLPGMTREGKSVAVFPVPPRQSVPVSPERLTRDLEVELADME